MSSTKRRVIANDRIMCNQGTELIRRDGRSGAVCIADLFDAFDLTPSMNPDGGLKYIHTLLFLGGGSI